VIELPKLLSGDLNQQIKLNDKIFSIEKNQMIDVIHSDEAVENEHILQLHQAIGFGSRLSKSKLDDFC
jgi:hypothetical protein